MAGANGHWTGPSEGAIDASMVMPSSKMPSRES